LNANRSSATRASRQRDAKRRLCDTSRVDGARREREEHDGKGASRFHADRSAATPSASTTPHSADQALGLVVLYAAAILLVLAAGGHPFA
jgi:hypothetical protein